MRVTLGEMRCHTRLIDNCNQAQIRKTINRLFQYASNGNVVQCAATLNKIFTCLIRNDATSSRPAFYEDTKIVCENGARTIYAHSSILFTGKWHLNSHTVNSAQFLY